MRNFQDLSIQEVESLREFFAFLNLELDVNHKWCSQRAAKITTNSATEYIFSELVHRGLLFFVVADGNTFNIVIR